ncbi:MAG: septum formation initiator family protein [Bacteroidetes bacterium]|nr:septum formation initiator family protein [Bacteroidota bacterium]
MKYLKLIKNKYILSTLIFLVWLIIFDKNNMIDQVQKEQEYQKLKNEADYYEAEIKKARTERDELFTNDATLEKFAREKYFMKKENEELFIMIDTSKKE